MQKFETKLLIIGSGPAGMTAAVYAARAALKPILVNGMQPGGQLTITNDVENYPGFADPIQGPWLMQQMTQQAENVGTQIIHDYVESVDFTNYPFTINLSSKDQIIASSVIISTGATAKWLHLDSEQKFLGYGVSGCATCDGFFFKNKEVIVVGGGNTAVEEALFLTHHASKVTLIHRRSSLRAEKLLQERLFNHPKIKIIWDHMIEEITGTEEPNKSVTGALIKHITSGVITQLNADGVFIAIGHKPNTAMFLSQLIMDDEGYIITAPNSTQTNIDGVFAAGDVQDKIFRQAVTAAGTGCMAALEAEKFLSR